MTAESKIQGSQAVEASRAVRGMESVAAEAMAEDFSPTGFQRCRSATRAAMEASAAMMSAAQGPQKFETRNCAKAKLNPATKIAGQVRFNPLRPATTNTR